MQSRACCHWLLPTSSPLSSLCSEQAPHVACRSPVQLGVRALLLASERASALTSLCSPRKAVASGRACRLVARPTRAKYHRPPLSPAHTNTAYRVPRARFFVVSSAAAQGSELLLAACINLLPCMLSPPRHNRLIWRRTGMRYDHPPLACLAYRPRPASPLLRHQSSMSLVLTLHPCCCRQRGSLCLALRQMLLQPR